MQWRQVQSAASEEGEIKTHKYKIGTMWQRTRAAAKDLGVRVDHRLAGVENLKVLQKKADLMLGYISRSVVCKTWEANTLV